MSDTKGIKPGEYRYRTFVIVGSLEDVRTTLLALHEEFNRRIGHRSSKIAHLYINPFLPSS